MKNAPALDPEGRILLCTQGRLVALEERERTVHVVWEYVTGSHVPGPVVVDAEGNARVHSSDGLLHCVSPAGKQVFSPAHVGEPLGWAAPVVDSAGNTYISAYDGGLLRVDANGKTGGRPYFRSRSKFDSAGIIHDGVLFIGSEDGYVFAFQLDEDGGKNLWNHAAEQGYAGGFVNSSPAVAEDAVLVVAARDETLYGFRPGGTVAWSTKMPGLLLGSPVIDPQGHVYVGVSQAQRGREARGLLVCLDGNSHRIRWQYQAAGPVESTPAIGDDGTIYFGDNSGTIHAVDNQGSAQWTAKVESAVRSATTMVGPQRVAFGLDDDTLVVLECASSGLAHTGWPKIGRTLGQSGTA
jgi:outer membrane protein assembly factor BamB